MTLALAVVNSFRYLNTSISCPHSLLCTRLMRSRSGICWWSLRFLISGMIFVAFHCIISILSMSRLKCRVQNCTACSRCGWNRDLYNERISSFFVPEIAVNEPQYSVGHFADFICSFLLLEVFGDYDSQIQLLICCQQLLIGHVIVALHVVASDVHHRTFINIEIHLPLDCPLNKFIDIIL